ncbi:MAG: hypothetical protein WCI88_06325 [Chloroflexota bacterium]
MMKQLTEPLPLPRRFVQDMLQKVEYMIFKMFAEEPGERYVDMGAFAVALERLSSRIPATPPQIDEREESFDDKIGH